MSKFLEKWTCQLSRAEIKDLLEGVDRSMIIPDYQFPEPGLKLDAFDAAVVKLYEEIEQLESYDIIAYPSMGDLEFEYQLELFDIEDGVIGTAVIIIGEEAKNPVNITVEFND